MNIEQYYYFSTLPASASLCQIFLIGFFSLSFCVNRGIVTPDGGYNFNNNISHELGRNLSNFLYFSFFFIIIIPRLRPRLQYYSTRYYFCFMYRTTTARKYIIVRIVSASVVVGVGWGSDFYNTILLLLFTMQSIPTKTRLLGYYRRVYTVRIYCIVYYIIIAGNKQGVCAVEMHNNMRPPSPRCAVQLSRDAFTLRCCSATTLDMPYYNTYAVQDNSRRRPTPCCPLSDTSDMLRNPITIVCCVTGGETNEKKIKKKYDNNVILITTSRANIFVFR